MTDQPRILVPPPLLFGTVLICCLSLDGRLGQGHMTAGWARIAGFAFVAAGAMLIICGLGLFYAQGTRPEPWKPATTLVTNGIYRFSRNPMYLGMAAVYGGIALAFLSGLAALLLVPLQLFMNRIVIPREEAYLSRRFGHAYVRYLGRSRRWL